jgi:D-alanine-D-alanine ligase-like ATP-grasp enzyme
LKNESDVLAAFRLAEAFDSKVIIEEYIKGNNYRILVVGEKSSGGCQKNPLWLLATGNLPSKSL